MPRRKAFPLRIDPDLYAALRRWADAELRSVNGQIEFLLKRAVRERQRDQRDDRGSDKGSDGRDDERSQ